MVAYADKYIISVLIANRRRLFLRKYDVSKDSGKFLLDNTANDGDLQNAVLNVNDGAAYAKLENADVVEREKASRMRLIMSGAVDECAVYLRTTLVRHHSLSVPSQLHTNT